MFKDTEKELRRLEAELLAQDEQWEEEPAEETASVDDILSDPELNALLGDTQVIGDVSAYQNHANNYGAQTRVLPHVYNNDHLDADPEDFSEELLDQPKEKGVTALTITACLLAVGILCVAVWWVARYGGLF